MLSAIGYLYQTIRLMTELEHFRAQKDAFFKSHPLMSVENWLPVPIRAGEKLFDEAKSLAAEA